MGFKILGIMILEKCGCGRVRFGLNGWRSAGYTASVDGCCFCENWG